MSEKSIKEQFGLGYLTKQSIEDLLAENARLRERVEAAEARLQLLPQTERANEQTELAWIDDIAFVNAAKHELTVKRQVERAEKAEGERNKLKEDLVFMGVSHNDAGEMVIRSSVYNAWLHDVGSLEYQQHVARLTASIRRVAAEVREECYRRWHDHHHLGQAAFVNKYGMNKDCLIGDLLDAIDIDALIERVQAGNDDSAAQDGEERK
jgi:hypothetical protein